MSAGDGARPAVPEVLWSPEPAERQAANVTRFLEAVEADRGLRLGSYEELWQWSVDELEDFWDAIWRFYDVRASTPTRQLRRRRKGRVRSSASRALPGCQSAATRPA